MLRIPTEPTAAYRAAVSEYIAASQRVEAILIGARPRKRHERHKPTMTARGVAAYRAKTGIEAKPASGAPRAEPVQETKAWRNYRRCQGAASSRSSREARNAERAATEHSALTSLEPRPIIVTGTCLPSDDALRVTHAAIDKFLTR